MSSLSTSPWLLYGLLGLITLVIFQMTSVVIYQLVNFSAVHYDILIIYIITSAFLANLFHQVRDKPVSLIPTARIELPELTSGMIGTALLLPLASQVPRRSPPLLLETTPRPRLMSNRMSRHLPK